MLFHVTQSYLGEPQEPQSGPLAHCLAKPLVPPSGPGSCLTHTPPHLVPPLYLFPLDSHPQPHLALSLSGPIPSPYLALASKAPTTGPTWPLLLSSPPHPHLAPAPICSKPPGPTSGHYSHLVPHPFPYSCCSHLTHSLCHIRPLLLSGHPWPSHLVTAPICPHPLALYHLPLPMFISMLISISPHMS